MNGIVKEYDKQRGYGFIKGMMDRITLFMLMVLDQSFKAWESAQVKELHLMLILI